MARNAAGFTQYLRYLHNRMPKLRHTVLACIFVLSYTHLMAQNATIDSLRSLLVTAKDTTRVNILNKLGKAHWYIDPQITIKYAAEAIILAEKIGFHTGMASGYNNTGVGYYQQNNYAKALEWYQKALAKHRENGNFLGEGHLLSNMGLIYWKQGALATAVDYYLRSLKIWEEHNLENEMAGVFDNVGNVYNEQEEYDRALSNYFKAVAIQKKHSSPPQERSMTLSNIGTAYLGKGEYSQALKYFLQSLDVLGEDEKESRAVALSNIGLTYIELKDFTKAKEYLERALVLQEEIEDSDGMIHTLLGLAKTRQEQGGSNESAIYAKRALKMAQTINDRPVLAEAWQMLSEIAAKQGDYKTAYDNYLNFVKARDSINDNEHIYEIAKLQAGFETQKKQAEIELLKSEHEQQAFRRNAIGAGLIALLVIAVLIVSSQRLRIRKNNQLESINKQLINQSEQLQEQTMRLKELDQVKSTFFANISHEFRTPLTLILNSLSDRISTVKSTDENAELEQLEIMSRNGRRLLNLINQLLDLSKLESGHLKLARENCNLNQLLKVVHASFSSLSVTRQIHFNLTQAPEELICQIDADKVEKILFNLLSNAFKFTPVGGSIDIDAKLEQDFLFLSVGNTGPGIQVDQLAHVFDRFYQGKQYYSDEQGTGIGLALTKELVELHGGTISVESNSDRTRFEVKIPYVPGIKDEVSFPVATGRSMPEDSSILPVLTSTEKFTSSLVGEMNQTRATVLLIEDNQDLRNYIKGHLIENYEVLETENGKAGLEKAFASIPDLVITDWMMPEMDGLELCSRLKTDERTSHIPIIMVTALATDDAKFQGLETGADEYLTKPFDNRELNIRIRNLIESRKLLRERFSRELHLGPKKIDVTSMDEKFLEKVMQAIETHIGDPDFNMDKFGQEVSLSRMQLHRKLKALTGESPGEFLRTMRLKRAKQLLESRAGNVSEIAYEVGFNNLSYFSKCYREQFGIAPNESFSTDVTKVSVTVTA